MNKPERKTLINFTLSPAALTIRDAAIYLGLGASASAVAAVERAIRDGSLRAHKIGERAVITKTDADRFLAASSVVGSAERRALKKEMPGETVGHQSQCPADAIAYPLKNAAALCGCKIWTLRRAIWGGTLPARVMGKRLIVLRHDLEKWISSSPLVRHGAGPNG